MKNNRGFISIIILVIAILGVVGYFTYKNYVKPPDSLVNTPTPSTVSETIVTSVIDQWIPKVKWDKASADTSFSNFKNADVKGVSRKGTILNPDKDGNPFNIEDLLPNVDKELENLGWKSSLPVGASGPNVRLSTYYKNINGIQKILKVEIEVNPEVKCPCVNTITVFQEQ